MLDPFVAVIIPALNEEQAIGGVVRSVVNRVNRVVVVDNGSTDSTAEVARAAGAQVVSVPEPGYGRACLAGMDATRDMDIIVFMDGDASDDPADLDALLAPILRREAEFVIGSRLTGEVEQGALTVTQCFGNTLACTLMRLIWGSRFTDLGPFRAITRPALNRLRMEAPTFGWTVEMQARILKQGIPYAEVPVSYRRRIGVSKISGTVRGVVLAGWYILTTIGLEAIRPNRSQSGRRRAALPEAKAPTLLPRTPSGGILTRDVRDRRQSDASSNHHGSLGVTRPRGLRNPRHARPADRGARVPIRASR